jgi:16S rRNA (uracil1498-N3)-methyltransferase
MPRFHCPLPLHPGHVIALPDEVARHAISALRLRDGEAVTLFNGDGAEYDGVLEVHPRHSAVRLTARREVSRESPLAITLVQGVSSGERMDLTIQKAVELGVAAIQPVLMRRTVVKLAGEKLERRRAHWQAVAVSACEQCGRNTIPQVAPILDFFTWLAATPKEGLRLLLDPEAAAGLRSLGAPESGAVLLAGPEGGFDPEERRQALAAGFVGVRLGPRVLRTETAALATLAAIQALWGDFS